MKISLLILFLPLTIIAQNKLPDFDGVVNFEEWNSSEKHLIEYEISLGNNIPSQEATEVYITYSSTDLYVGFIAYADMKTLRWSIRNRDEGYRDDFVMIGIDTYGDGRYMVSLGAEPTVILNQKTTADFLLIILRSTWNPSIYYQYKKSLLNLFSQYVVKRWIA